MATEKRKGLGGDGHRKVRTSTARKIWFKEPLQAQVDLDVVLLWEPYKSRQEKILARMVPTIPSIRMTAVAGDD
ncbi:hypothetical protein UP06_29440 [Bradyrhizobium sp. LTSP857]|nr:hypothetical protein UP06_29440 [Bradyrhizobium sp. LTSP857]